MTSLFLLYYYTLDRYLRSVLPLMDYLTSLQPVSHHNISEINKLFYLYWAFDFAR